MNDVNSLSHTSWNCKYHIVFAPKYRRKVFYGQKRREIGEILRTLCRDIKNTVQLEEGKNHRSGSMSRSYPHAGRDTAEIFGLELHGISEGKKQSDAVREIPGAEIQVSQ